MQHSRWKAVFGGRGGVAWSGAAVALVFAVAFFSFTHAEMEANPRAERLADLVRACPVEIAGQEPSRVVLQVIDDTLYKWEEHALGEGGEFCIILKKPQDKALSAAEARDLLESSARWIEQSPPTGAAETLDPRDPRIDLPPAAPPSGGRSPEGQDPAPAAPDKAAPPAYPAPGGDSRTGAPDKAAAIPETVIGPDERVRVTDTEAHPWRTIGYIGNRYRHDDAYSFRGTGFIAGPYLVLTNGHMVYDDSRGGYATDLTFAPGQRQACEGCLVVQPYGRRVAAWWQTNNNYIDAVRYDPANQYRYDYAGVFFNTSFPSVGIATYMPLVFNVEPTAVNVSGYPKEVQDEINSKAQWRSFGNVVAVFDRILTYLADTSGGNSGSPVWEYFADTGYRRVVAIHAYGDPRANGGPRLVSQNLPLIEEWLSWRPSGPRPDPGGRGGCFVATAAYGSYLNAHVWTLRKFRDRCLLTRAPGRTLVRAYYRHAPAWAAWLERHEAARLGVRVALAPVVFGLERPCGFGVLGVLVLGAPAWWRIRRRGERTKANTP